MKIKQQLFYIITIIFLVVMNFYTMNHVNNLNTKFDRYENAISALNDTIHKNFEDGKTIWTKQAPEININDLINSEYFKSLSQQEKEYYKELSKIKGLISSSKIELEKQGELLASLQNNPGNINNDSISFKLGQELTFKELDTTKNLQWNSKIILDKNINFAFNYDYKFNIQSTYERQKDKSIIVKYKIDDSDLTINKMYNFIIPTEQPKTKFGIWINKNKKPLFISGGSILFLAGGYLGYNLAK